MKVQIFPVSQPIVFSLLVDVLLLIPIYWFIYLFVYLFIYYYFFLVAKPFFYL